jgi:hypothetical protein
MIIVGISQIFAGVLLISAGVTLLLAMLGTTQDVVGGVCIFYGAWTLFGSIERVTPRIGA